MDAANLTNGTAMPASNMTDPSKHGMVCSSLYLMQSDGSCGKVDDAMGVTILLGVAKSLATTLALGLVGFYLSRAGALGPEALRAMGGYTKKFAVPCLFIVKMADGVKLAFLEDVWFVLLMPFAHVLVGVVLGYVVSVLVPHPSGHRGVIQACVALPNAPAVPFVLLNAISDNMVPAEISSRLGGRASPLAYLNIYLITLCMLQWGVGSLLLSSSAKELAAQNSGRAPAQLASGQQQQQQTSIYSSMQPAAGQPAEKKQPSIYSSPAVKGPAAAGGLGTGWLAPDTRQPVEAEQEFDMRQTSGALLRTTMMLLRERALEQPTVAGIPADWGRGSSSSANNDPLLSGDAASSNSRPRAVTWCVEDLYGLLMAYVFQPPTVGALLGLLIGVTPVLQTQLVDESGAFYWLFDAIKGHGDAAVAILMLMLGANLAQGSILDVRGGLGFGPNIAVAVAKLIITPLLGLGSYWLLNKQISMCDPGHATCPYNDAMWLAMLVALAAPSSTALLVMASVADQGIGEVGPNGPVTTSVAVAGIMRVQYLLMPVVLTVTLTCILFAIASNGHPTPVLLVLKPLASCGK